MQTYYEAAKRYNAIQYNEPLKVHSTPRENAPVNLSVNFQIEGNATQETVDALSDIGERLRQIIREEMEEVASDNRRIAYI